MKIPFRLAAAPVIALASRSASVLPRRRRPR